MFAVVFFLEGGPWNDGGINKDVIGSIPPVPPKPIQEVHSPSTNLLCHPSPQAQIPQNLEAQFTNFSPPIDVAGSKLEPG